MLLLKLLNVQPAANADQHWAPEMELFSRRPASHLKANQLHFNPPISEKRVNHSPGKDTPAVGVPCLPSEPQSASLSRVSQIPDPHNTVSDRGLPLQWRRYGSEPWPRDSLGAQHCTTRNQPLSEGLGKAYWRQNWGSSSNEIPFSRIHCTYYRESSRWHGDSNREHIWSRSQELEAEMALLQYLTREHDASHPHKSCLLTAPLFQNSWSPE